MSRFSREGFNETIKKIINDPAFKVEVAEASKMKAEGYTIKEVAVTEGFRGFCKKLLEKFGVDKFEAQKVMEPEFQFTNVDGLYEFIATAVYEYMDDGNKFNFLPRYDFKGGIELETKEEVEKTSKLKDKDGNVTEYHTLMGKHKKLKASSGCPSYLKKRIDIQ